ncbi:MAG: hypothetical protein ACRD8U_02760, partial [Pyrinomonadaceae bacterium]
YVEFEVPRLDLGMGDYHVSVSMRKYQVPLDKTAILFYRERYASFSVRRRELHQFHYLYEPEIRMGEERAL